MDSLNEPDAVKLRYQKRTLNAPIDARYTMFAPDVLYGVQERERAIVSLLKDNIKQPLSDLSVLEIGCGNGGNLLELVRMGFSADHLVGNELLTERAQKALSNLPRSTQVMEGDAMTLNLPICSYDIVYQSTVFSSLLDDDFQQQLAKKMWSLVKPGGAILWYDFTFNNPNNSDVRGVPVKRIRTLFPEAVTMQIKRVTLAPPIGRLVTKAHPALYSFFNAMPFLRTHVLCWVKK
jgi:SAM-dependent methyltransferase